MDDKKNKEKDYTPVPIVTVSGREFNVFSNRGNARGKTHISEAGIVIRCMTCNYEAPDEIFMSKSGGFSGCPECGDINVSHMVFMDEDGLQVPNDRTSPGEYLQDEFVRKPVQHTIMIHKPFYS